MTKRVKYLIIYLAVMIALTIVRISAGEGYLGNTDVQIDNTFTILTQIVCMGIIPVFTMILIDKKDGLEVVREGLYFKKPKFKGAWLWIMLLSVLNIIINGGISTAWYGAIRWFGYTPVVADGEVISTVGEFLFAIFMSAILPAFFEEITHRGLVLNVSQGSTTKRALTSALLFGLMHQNVLQTGYTFVSGLIIAYTVLYTGSIFPAMVIHFINNACVQLRIFSASYNGLFYQGFQFIYANMNQWWFVLILTVLWAFALIGTFFILRHFKLRSEKAGGSVLAVEREDGDSVVAKFLWIAIIAFGVITTLYSFIWGLLR